MKEVKMKEKTYWKLLKVVIVINFFMQEIMKISLWLGLLLVILDFSVATYGLRYLNKETIQHQEKFKIGNKITDKLYFLIFIILIITYLYSLSLERNTIIKVLIITIALISSNLYEKNQKTKKK